MFYPSFVSQTLGVSHTLAWSPEAFCCSFPCCCLCRCPGNSCQPVFSCNKVSCLCVCAWGDYKMQIELEMYREKWSIIQREKHVKLQDSVQTFSWEIRMKLANYENIWSDNTNGLLYQKEPYTKAFVQCILQPVLHWHVPPWSLAYIKCLPSFQNKNKWK